MDLKPCPWCSGEALVESVPRIFGNRKDKMYLYRVACVRIGCTVTKWQNSVGVAVVAWNTRALADAPRETAPNGGG